MFPGLVFAAPVQVDLQGVDPPREAREKVEAEIIRRTLKQKPN